MTSSTRQPDWPLQLLPDLDVPKPETEDVRLWSVTTILKVLSSGGLDYWSKEQVAKALVGIRHSLVQRVEEDGIDEVVRWGINATYRKPKDKRSASQLGTDFHLVGEEIAITGKCPAWVWDDAELAPLVRQYLDWLARAQPTFTAAEMPVYSLTYGHAGTCDGGMILQGVNLIHDFKTTAEPYNRQGVLKTPYADAALQLSAYRNSEWAVPVSPRRWEQHGRRYYLFGEPERDQATPVPHFDGGVVIHVTPISCEAYWARCDEEVYQSFLYVEEAARWQNDLSKTAIGNKLLFEKVA